jgi:type II secretory pathway pseudopilin PulG
VLVTLLLVGIVIPAIMHAITSATRAAAAAQHRGDAAALAQSELSSLMLAVTQGQNPATSGDIEQDGFQYHWQAAIGPWNQDTTGFGIQDIDLTLSWPEGARTSSLTVSTLAYNRQQVQQ